MDARRYGPIAGTVAMCATVWFSVSSSVLAQYGPMVYGGPMIGSPVMAGPSMAGASYGQQVPPGIMLGSIGNQGRPVMVRPGANAAVAGDPNDPASMVPRLPMVAVSDKSSAAVGTAGGSAGAGQSENFIVLCRDPKLAAEVSKEAERLRRDLAIHWLGSELPPWSRRCPIQVTAGPKLGAGGETRFALYNGNVGDWQMSVQGTPERILDSVLPHEITHTILASHFAPLNVHVPRWADEGACTTVEHDSEQNKHKKMLVDFMRTGRAMPFNRMFTLKDYPDDILPLYAQGHSVVEFLIAQSGPKEFISFLHQGMQTGNWEKSVRDHFGYETLGKLQIQWNSWIAAGRGDVATFAGRALPSREGNVTLVSGPPAEPRLRGRGPLDGNQVPEGAAVALGSYTNVSAQASELNLRASNVDQTTDDSFYRKRLQGNLRPSESLLR